ncbi:MAG: hypothetical protein ACIAQU_03240, partial [Phycisphaerales bacterium JB064]
WVDVRVPVWAAAGLTIGLDPVQVAALGTQASAAADLKTEWLNLKAQATAKGAEYRAAAGAMRSTAAAQVVQVRGFARTQANPDAVFAAAQLPIPAQPGPTPAPGVASDFRVELLQSGSLKFTFDCEHPANVKGVTYKVLRQGAPQEPYQFLLNAKKREFEDSNLPQNSTMLTYVVTAQTSTKDGNPSYFTVRFGGGNQAQIVAQGPVVESQAS